jgi:hypothetical protein
VEIQLGDAVFETSASQYGSEGEEEEMDVSEYLDLILDISPIPEDGQEELLSIKQVGKEAEPVSKFTILNFLDFRFIRTTKETTQAWTCRNENFQILCRLRSHFPTF